jgi:uroporphyrinogen decarboxylase
MTQKENLISLFRRTGYETAPHDINFCDYQVEQYKKHTGALVSYEDFFNLPLRRIMDFSYVKTDPEQFRKFYNEPLAEGTVFSPWGVAQEPAKDARYHFVRMRHPMANFDSLEQVQSYPFPVLPDNIIDLLRGDVEAIHAAGNACAGRMSVTIWETAWLLRGMETLLMEMMEEEPIAEALLDRLTEMSCRRARNYALAGVDILHIGDDVGIQRALLMSEGMYVTWLKPRIAKVIAAAKAVKPDILIFYHSCGYVLPLIPHFIDVGVEILDPVQPESMDFAEVYSKFGGALSFNGTLGIQHVLPFGSPQDVKDVVKKNLDIAGPKGGLLVCPTHTVEPEIPWENIEAYFEACREYTC